MRRLIASVLISIIFAFMMHKAPTWNDSFRVTEVQGQYHKIFYGGWPFAYVMPAKLGPEVAVKLLANIFIIAFGIFILTSIFKRLRDKQSLNGFGGGGAAGGVSYTGNK
jgi:hypothetical protein